MSTYDTDAKESSELSTSFDRANKRFLILLRIVLPFVAPALPSH